MPPYLFATTTGILLRLHIQPRASQTGIAGPHGDALKLRLSAPPVDGAANDELLRFLAIILQVPRASVTLTAGSASRRKTVRVDGLTEAQAVSRLEICPGA